MKKAFGFTISCMMIFVGAFGTMMAIGIPWLYNSIGIILSVIVCLTFVCLWGCLMALLFSTTKATISAGKGIGSLFALLIDKIK